MKIGFIGLGKLGYPVATAMAYAGHDVMGYDMNPANMTYDPRPYQETGPYGEGDFNDYIGVGSLLREKYGVGDLTFGSMAEVAAHAEVIFVAVQTPHDPEFEGITPIPLERRDFDYSFIKMACHQLQSALNDNVDYGFDQPVTIAIISTMLPGTMRRDILPIFDGIAPVVYNPAFIAMGTTWRDFIDPEFVLLGGDFAVQKVADALAQCLVNKTQSVELGSTTLTAPTPKATFITMSIESAELTKVAYNTFIGMKIGFANTIMEICHEIEHADCDQVIDGLSLAHRRIISPAYLRGGMGDGGGCHPRDNIAMSFLAQELKLSCNPFEDIMHWREYQTDYLMRLIIEQHKVTSLPVVLMGTAFKPGTNITTGSPALLLADLMQGRVPFTMFDPHVFNDDPAVMAIRAKSIFVISTKHDVWQTIHWPHSSIVIDPHRYIADQEGVTVIRVGEG